MRDDTVTGNDRAGIVITHQANSVLVESAPGTRTLCSVPRRIATPVCGDHVRWQSTGDGCGQITAVATRSNLLTRPGHKGRERPLAANLDRLFVVIAPQPEAKPALIDKYLVAADYFDIPATLILNKTDLLTPGNRDTIDAMLVTYTGLGYGLITLSAKQADACGELADIIGTRTAILVGQSGVGKSSLVRVLSGDSDIATGAISDASGFGRHTTSATTLYRTHQGGHIVDSPGVRDFGLWHLPTDAIAPGFAEFKPLLGACRFRDCDHLDSPGCAIVAAVEKEQVSRARYESFRALRRTLEKPV